MNLIYKFVDKFLMNDFSKPISTIINNNLKQEIVIFDIGCFQGNFSRSLKKEIEKKIAFYLFDPNPNLDIADFQFDEDNFYHISIGKELSFSLNLKTFLSTQ